MYHWNWSVPLRHAFAADPLASRLTFWPGALDELGVAVRVAVTAEQFAGQAARPLLSVVSAAITAAVSSVGESWMSSMNQPSSFGRPLVKPM